MRQLGAFLQNVRTELQTFLAAGIPVRHGDEPFSLVGADIDATARLGAFDADPYEPEFGTLTRC